MWQKSDSFLLLSHKIWNDFKLLSNIFRWLQRAVLLFRYLTSRGKTVCSFPHSKDCLWQEHSLFTTASSDSSTLYFISCNCTFISCCTSEETHFHSSCATFTGYLDNNQKTTTTSKLCHQKPQAADKHHAFNIKHRQRRSMETSWGCDEASGLSGVTVGGTSIISQKW